VSAAGGSADQRVALAEIKGDVKLILAGQERTHSDVQEIRRTLDSHNRRIDNLEADKNRRDGLNSGVSLSTKVIWSVGSLLVGSGGVLAVMEVLK
jgi:hypothetical protein